MIQLGGFGFIKDYDEIKRAGFDYAELDMPEIEALGGQDREAGGQAHGKSEQQKRNRARGTDGGQRRGSQKTADNDGIRHAVELLENVPQKEGKGKPQNDRQDPAGGHILLHRGNLRDDRDNVSGFIRRGNVIHSTPVS